MEPTTLAYLAGAMDSDGYFSIKRSTYHMRVRGDANNATYSELIGLKQVTPQIPQLLLDCFGGAFGMGKPGTNNSKPLYYWMTTNLKAATACQMLLPFLRVKHRQAEVLLELRESKNSKYLPYAYWFAQEYPDWQTMDLLTTSQVCEMLGYGDPASVSQAIAKGGLLSLPYIRQGYVPEQPRIPRLMVEQIKANLAPDGRARNMPPQLVKWRHRLYEQVRELNKIGIEGTPVYHRTGPYKPAA